MGEIPTRSNTSRQGRGVRRTLTWRNSMNASPRRRSVKKPLPATATGPDSTTVPSLRHSHLRHLRQRGEAFRPPGGRHQTRRGDLPASVCFSISPCRRRRSRRQRDHDGPRPRPRSRSSGSTFFPASRNGLPGRARRFPMNEALRHFPGRRWEPVSGRRTA